MPPSPKNAYPLKRLLGYTKSYRPQIWVAVIYTIINQLCDLAPAYLIGIAVDVVSEQENSIIAKFGIENVVTQLAVVSLLTLLVWSLESLSEYLSSKKWRNLAQTVQHELRIDTYNHLELEVSYFEEHSTGVLLSILNDDINQLERFLDSGAVQIIQILISTLTVGISFVLVAPGIAPLGYLADSLNPLGFFCFSRNNSLPAMQTCEEKAGSINSRLANNIAGVATIKSFTAQTYETKRVIAESEAYRRSNRKAIAFSAAFFPLIRFVVVVGFIATPIFRRNSGGEW